MQELNVGLKFHCKTREKALYIQDMLDNLQSLIDCESSYMNSSIKDRPELDSEIRMTTRCCMTECFEIATVQYQYPNGMFQEYCPTHAPISIKPL